VFAVLCLANLWFSYDNEFAGLVILQLVQMLLHRSSVCVFNCRIVSPILGGPVFANQADKDRCRQRWQALMEIMAEVGFSSTVKNVSGVLINITLHFIVATANQSDV